MQMMKRCLLDRRSMPESDGQSIFKRKRGRPRKEKKFIKPEKKFEIEERLIKCAQKELEHIIYVGQLVERVLQSEFGAVLKALTAGRVSQEIASNKDNRLSSDRVLGRIEMADSLWNDLEQFVADKDKFMTPVNPSLEEQEFISN